MSAKNVVNKNSFVKLEKREKFEQIGVVTRFGDKGSSILPLLPDGKVDWKADRYVIWDSSWEALKKGGLVNEQGFPVTFLPVFKAPYRPKPSE